MKELWREFETWLSGHAPHLLKGLRNGATRDQITSAEAALGCSFPNDVVNSYLVHDGQEHPECFALYERPLFAGCPLLPLGTMVRQWSELKQVYDNGGFEGIRSAPDIHIREDWWNPLWIPLTANAEGDHPVCLDLAPGPGGRRGQVISWWHEDDNRGWLGLSFRDWFARYLKAVKAGEFVFSDKYGGIVARRDA